MTTNPTRLYIDVDGVVLRRTGRTEYGGRTEFEVAPHAEQFLRWAIGHFTSSWLTARARDGDIEEVARAFRLAVGVTDDLKALVRTIPVARWGVAKVQGIVLVEDFRWLDDNPDQASLAALEQHGLRDRLIEISTDQRPDDLVRVRGLLIDRCGAGG